MTVSQVILETGFIFENSVTLAALNRGRVAMLILFVSVNCVLVDELEAYLTLYFVGV